MESKSILSALAIILASGSLTQAAGHEDFDSHSAANAINELVHAGYVKVDSSSGQLVLEKSLFQILMEAGIVTQTKHSEIISAGCGSTMEQCGSPR